MLADSNILIGAAHPNDAVLFPFIEAHQLSISAVTVVEVLGFWHITPTEQVVLRELIRGTPILPVTSKVVGTAVALRQARRMSLGDSLIAATALRHDLPLVTRNTDDFEWIANLQLVDPTAR